MKISFIVPFKYQRLFDSYSDFHLVLAQHIGVNKEYTEFFEETPKYKILDNGAYELGFPVAAAELIDKAYQIKAHEIIIPDVFMNCNETLRKLDEFLGIMSKEKLLGKFKLMGAPQGKTNEEYMKCLGRMQSIKEIDIIGLSFLVVAKCFGEITACVEVLPNRQMLTKLIELMGFHDKEYHLLGLGDFKELGYQKKYPWIRGNDSSSAVKHAALGVRFDEDKGLPSPRHDIKFDFNMALSADEITLAMHNMGVIKKYAGADNV